MTPSLHAAKNGHVEVLKALLMAGAEADAVDNVIPFTHTVHCFGTVYVFRGGRRGTTL